LFEKKHRKTGETLTGSRKNGNETEKREKKQKQAAKKLPPDRDQKQSEASLKLQS
jgi:hypothetical protein